MIKQILNSVFGSIWLEMYNKTVIGFGFCDMQNYQCLGKIELSALSAAQLITLTSTLTDSTYHKNLVQ